MFADEIKDRLVAQGVGAFGTTIFIGSKAKIPTGDGPYLVIVETGGTGGARRQNPGAGLQRPSAQLSTRAANPVLARTMLMNAYNALGGVDGLHNIVLSGVPYINITARQEPTDIGLDAAQRIMFVFNIDAEKKPS